jgi:hypothetical protein
MERAPSPDEEVIFQPLNSNRLFYCNYKEVKPAGTLFSAVFHGLNLFVSIKFKS